MATTKCYDSKTEGMEGTFWKLRTGAPWRGMDVPEEFCPWPTSYSRIGTLGSENLLKIQDQLGAVLYTLSRKSARKT